MANQRLRRRAHARCFRAGETQNLNRDHDSIVKTGIYFCSVLHLRKAGRAEDIEFVGKCSVCRARRLSAKQLYLF